MARAKIKCKGINSRGLPCRNWARQGSLYCQLHHAQETVSDRQQMKETDYITSIVIVIIVVFGFGISSCLGCEGEFIKWLGN